MLRKNKLVVILATLLVLSSVLTACGGGGGDKTTGDVDVSGKTELIIANGADAPTLDPHGSNDNISSQINGLLYNRLV